MKSIYVLALGLLFTLSALAAPAEVIVVRHAEKPKDRNDNHLSPAGRERAERLPEFLKQSPELAKLGPPAALFATHLTKEGHGLRTIETLEPLAKCLDLKIETPFQSDNADKLAAQLLSKKKYNGKTVLICWTHEYIPLLIESLGIHPAPEKLPDDAYDRVYLIRYTADGPKLEMFRQDMESLPAPKHPKLFHFGKKKPN
jgi:hypothetical protein